MDDVPLSLLGKSKLRQFFSACRVAAFVPEPAPQDADAPDPQPVPLPEGPPLALADSEASAESIPTPPVVSTAAAAEENHEPANVDKTMTVVEGSGDDSSFLRRSCKDKEEEQQIKHKRPRASSMRCR